MAKPAQVLLIEPEGELRFRGPFTGAPVTSYIKLINPTSNKVYFKIKTTVPKKYCVRPNSGALKPMEVAEIAVCLQPCDFDPADKNKHKFMVQSLIAPDNDSDDYLNNDVWKDTKPEQLMDSKLKCVFENPVTTTAATKTTTTTTTTRSDTNTNNEKNKGTGDSVKSSPKVLEETEEKLLKAAQEVTQLRVEESALRQENLQLRRDLMKYRNAALEDARGLPAQSSNQFSPTSTSFLIAVAMVIVGYLLGKLI
ncbi:hypothetical protein HZH68_013045 [Vespula germanica]|uniref:MSP domain-containing protein n=4 Tax=Vespula TaxID=7451 RepID=A0A834JFL0_VESGE|nr:vesicle-associated membrane protein/synaptobrevin-binding protein [Vespula pensylvanica]XP_050861652.1 vesicle-associated membrane protein/synaptobrevin-binding protein-like [Vespula vulgaris]KAF7385731.1 hypothetical protein HZH66_011573 [Vespula vulgaris]KAF7387368.1 hypothetical protein HZH68_013045 [Vespula germanica]KAF7409369.1 hypothetical protein H0235_014221 [Vespula pensylvanica]